MVYLSGGLAHQDTFDLKPNAPAEVRGDFKPIPTNVPGVQFGEHLPKLARCMDKLVVVRSLVGQRDEHSSWQSYTATTMDAAKRENKPHFGSVVATPPGTDRSRGPRLRRPVADHAAQAVQLARSRLPRPRRRAREGRWRRNRGHEEPVRAGRPAPRPQDVARKPRRLPQNRGTDQRRLPPTPSTTGRSTC